MPDAVNVGPFAFSVERVVAVSLIWAFLAGSLWLVRNEDRRATRAPWWALAIGVGAARVSFVASHWGIFRSDPATIAYLWQGGFEPAAAIAAAAVVLAVAVKSRFKAAGSLLILAAASGLWFGYRHIEAQSPRPLFPEGVQLTDLDGRSVSLDSLSGRPFVVNLWASWCGPCRREMPMLVEVASSTPDIAVLLVNQGESRRVIRRFLEDEGLAARHILTDPGASLMRLTGSVGLPATLFVRPDGRIAEAHIGELSRAALLQELRRLSSR